ncbi:hypothetical protein TNCV_4631671 [Trichonephila clavipes]|nr:hypothetical protein TNCV_4631671 [Trichonephila clavipes]
MKVHWFRLNPSPGPHLQPSVTVRVLSDADCSAVGTGFESEEDMDVCKCIMPLRHGGTLNSRRAASPLVRLVEREERWEALDHPCSPSKLGRTQEKSYCHMYGAQIYG